MTSFHASPALRNKLESGQDGRGSSRKGAETIMLKMFAGGYLAMAGANAPSGLASWPIRVVLCDEVDRFPKSAGDEGDPVELAFQRTANFEHNRKRILVSTPGIDGASKIQTWHNLGDQRQYHVPCPHCSSLQVLRWERLRFTRPDGTPDLEHVTYQCEHCDQAIEERHKPTMVAAGRWIAQVPGGVDGTGKIVSFGSLSALYSPWARWPTLAAEWLKATASRDRSKLRVFTNVRLGLPFSEHETVLVSDQLERRRECYGQTCPAGARCPCPRAAASSDAALPAGILYLTAGVDQQDDRIELEVVGWGVGRESWGVQYSVLPGSPGEPGVWALLDAALSRTWQTEDGRRLGIATTAVDTGGHYTTQAYDFCRARAGRRVWAVKGGPIGTSIVDKVSWVGRGKATALRLLGVDEIKSTLMDRLRLEDAGPGYCHFPRGQARGYTQSWFDGLLSEHHISVRRAGHERLEWVCPTGVRNEPLDCRVYATAALEILSPPLDPPAVGKAKAPPSVANGSRRTGRRVLGRGVG